MLYMNIIYEIRLKSIFYIYDDLGGGDQSIEIYWLSVNNAKKN